MKYLIIMIGALALALGVTGPKIYKMCQIRGWIEGATASNETITQKWNQKPAEHPKGADVYWVAWSKPDIHQVGNHRTNLTPEQWEPIKIGDQIEIIRIPGNPSPYLREDIFASDGNFVFDGFLIIAEIGVAIAMAVNLIRPRPQSNADDHGQ